jgi:TPR repeat protein
VPLIINIGNAETKNLSYSEQQEMLRFLNEKIDKKDYSSAFELGLVYEDGIVDVDNNKVPNLEKATKYFILAYDKGDYRSGMTPKK